MLYALLVLWLIFAGLGYYVAVQKGRPEAEGLVLGFLFGPLGCLIVALLPSGPPAGRSPGHADRAWVDDAPVSGDLSDYFAGGGDPADDRLAEFLSAAGGKPRDALDLGAIARAPAGRSPERGAVDLDVEL
jgi:hypothetical protein